MYMYRNGRFAFNTLGQNSNVGKLKTLSGALDTMVRTKHAFQLIGRELAGEPGQVGGEDAGPALTCLVPAARRVRVRMCVQTHTHVSALHENVNSGLLYFLGIIINSNLQVYLLYLNFFL